MQDGFGTRGETKTYFKINEKGKVTIRVDEGTEGAVKVEYTYNNENKVRYDKYYDNFTGKIVGITVKDSDYGKQWVISFETSDGSKYDWQSNFTGSFVRAFLKQLPNINTEQPVTITPSSKIGDDGKTNNTLFVSQNGDGVGFYWKKDTNGMPESELITVSGKQQTDYTKQCEFFEKWISTNFTGSKGTDTPVSTESTLGGSNLASGAISTNDTTVNHDEDPF